jgi:hypothetical protein
MCPRSAPVAAHYGMQAHACRRRVACWRGDSSEPDLRAVASTIRYAQPRTEPPSCPSCAFVSGLCVRHTPWATASVASAVSVSSAFLETCAPPTYVGVLPFKPKPTPSAKSARRENTNQTQTPAGPLFTTRFCGTNSLPPIGHAARIAKRTAMAVPARERVENGCASPTGYFPVFSEERAHARPSLGIRLRRTHPGRPRAVQQKVPNELRHTARSYACENAEQTQAGVPLQRKLPNERIQAHHRAAQAKVQNKPRPARQRNRNCRTNSSAPPGPARESAERTLANRCAASTAERTHAAVRHAANSAERTLPRGDCAETLLRRRKNVISY